MIEKLTEILAENKEKSLRKRILNEFAAIKPIAPADRISITFNTTYITENTSNESLDRLSWLSVATACRNASEVPNAKAEP